MAAGKVAAGGKALQLMKSVLEQWQKGHGFDRTILSKVVDGGIGRCVVLLTVEQHHLNLLGTLHGGVGASLVDVITSLALINDSEESLKRMGVSVDLNLTYLSPAKLGDEILVDARTLKVGKRMAFTECEIRSKDTNKLLVKGSHTKFVGEEMHKFADKQ